MAVKDFCIMSKSIIIFNTRKGANDAKSEKERRRRKKED